MSLFGGCRRVLLRSLFFAHRPIQPEASAFGASKQLAAVVAGSMVNQRSGVLTIPGLVELALIIGVVLVVGAAAFRAAAIRIHGHGRRERPDFPLVSATVTGGIHAGLCSLLVPCSVPVLRVAGPVAVKRQFMPGEIGLRFGHRTIIDMSHPFAGTVPVVTARSLQFRGWVRPLLLYHGDDRSFNSHTAIISSWSPGLPTNPDSPAITALLTTRRPGKRSWKLLREPNALTSAVHTASQ